MAGFVCFYYGNTGSSWLLGTLSTSPDMCMPGFEPVERWAWDVADAEKAAWMRTALTPPGPTQEAFDAWCEILSVSPQFKVRKTVVPGFTVTGWKMTWGALDDPDVILDVLADTDAKAIILSRENRVKHALSLYRYHDEGKSQFEMDGVRPPSTVPKESMDKWLKESQRLHDESAAFARTVRARLGDEKVIDVAYEEFVDEAGKEATIQRVGPFVGLDPAGMERSYFEKATADDLESAIVNFDELKRAYRFSRYRTFFKG